MSEKVQPGRTENIFRSITSIAPSQLADNDLFPFKTLQEQQQKSHLGERLPLFNLSAEAASETSDDGDAFGAEEIQPPLEDAVQSFQP